MTDANRLQIKKNIKSLLESLPKEPEAHKELFKMLDEMTGIIPSIFALYNHARLSNSTTAGLKLASLYKEKKTTEVLLKDLINDGLFEEISNSQGSKDKVISLIRTFIEVSSNKSIDSENIINNLVVLDKKLTPINIEIQKKEDDISKSDFDLNPEKYNILTELIELKEKKETLLKERSSLTKNMGNLSQAMINYYEIAKDLSNPELLNAILSQPTYQYKLLNDQNNAIKEDEIGIFNDGTQLILKANFENKEFLLRDLPFFHYTRTTYTSSYQIT
jgi:hypothetical protein